MNVLGIDYSLNGTGLSIYDNKIVFKKVFTSTKKHFEQNEEVFILSPKFDTMEQKLDWVCDAIINCTCYDFVCMEDHIGSYYNWMDGYAIIKHYLRKINIPYICISPTQLKKYAGTGNANKQNMAELLLAEYGIDLDYLGPSANNIVDATWLSIVGVDYYNKFILEQPIHITEQRLTILNKLYEKFGRTA